MNASKPSKESSTAVAEAESLSEEAFLTQEAEAAKTAIAQTLRDVRGDLLAVRDPSAWARRYPWISVGLAAAAGVAAGAVAGSAIHRFLPGRKKAATPDATNETSAENATASPLPEPIPSQEAGGLREPWLDLLKTVLTTLVTSTVHAIVESRSSHGRRS